MLNPTAEQEKVWHDQRLSALAAHRQAVVEVMRLRDRATLGRFLADYRNKWGAVSAEGLVMRARAEWEKRYV